MLLRPSCVLLASNARGYNNRVMVYPHRRARSRYLAPKKGEAPSPVANKTPEEYGNTWDPRYGREWHSRMRGRGHYRHWPWARWTDDPLRHHRSQECRRTLSARPTGAGAAAANAGVPEWDYYAAVGEDYGLPPHFPLRYVAPFIHRHAADVWGTAEIERHLDAIAAGAALPTVRAVAEHPERLHRWADANRGAVPAGVVLHAELVCADVARQHARRTHRAREHHGGVLRTPEMARYYALPHMRTGPAMPERLQQPEGVYPWGRYSRMLGRFDIHPLQKPDGLYTHRMYSN